MREENFHEGIAGFSGIIKKKQSEKFFQLKVSKYIKISKNY